METLGSLIDKLVVVELKIFHTNDLLATNLQEQKARLCQEINTFVARATAGKILVDDLAVESNKVYDKDIKLPMFTGEIGELVSSLCMINCDIWHKVDQSYHVEDLKHHELVELVNNLAVVNLHRNKCIEAIDRQFKAQVML